MCLLITLICSFIFTSITSIHNIWILCIHWFINFHSHLSHLSMIYENMCLLVTLICNYILTFVTWQLKIGLQSIFRTKIGPNHELVRIQTKVQFFGPINVTAQLLPQSDLQELAREPAVATPRRKPFNYQSLLVTKRETRPS